MAVQVSTLGTSHGYTTLIGGVVVGGGGPEKTLMLFPEQCLFFPLLGFYFSCDWTHLPLMLNC